MKRFIELHVQNISAVRYRQQVILLVYSYSRESVISMVVSFKSLSNYERNKGNASFKVVSERPYKLGKLQIQKLMCGRQKIAKL